MVNQYSADVPKGFNVPKQVRLDSITGIQNEDTLKNLGENNNLAFKYYEGLEIYCKDEKTTYVWREVVGIEIGLLNSHFIYPTYDAVDGIDYSGKSFNFFLITSSNNPLPDGSETKIEAGSNTNVTGTGTTLDPYIISSTSEDSEIFLEEGDNVTITGIGTFLDPYVINADAEDVGLIKTELNEIIAPTQTLSIINSESTGKVLVTREYVESVIPSTPDGSETKIEEGGNVIITGTGTVIDPYIINSIPLPSENVYIFSGDDINVTGSGTVEDPFYINATGLDLKIDKNPDIVGNTFTKITYDNKGLVLSGEDATTVDIDDSIGKRYVTDSDLINLSNLSGVNNGDETTFSIQSKRPIKTIEGQSLEGFGNIQLTTTDISEGSNLYYTNERFDTRLAITSAEGELSGTYPNPILVNNAVISKVLTGLNVTGSTITAADSILSAFGKLQNQVNSLVGSSIYQGVWNASTNSPTLTSGVGIKGYYYKVNVAGNTNLDGISDWNIGDWVIFNGITWDKIDNTDLVSSVNGFTGAVNLTTSNITEGANLYYTDIRVSANIDVAANTAARHNAVTLGTTNGLSLSVQQLSLGLSSTSATGALSSTDWNIFNNKQAALGFTPENIINKSDSYTVSSSTTYSSTKALVDGLFLKKDTTSTAITSTFTITNNTTSVTFSAFTGKIVDNSTVPATITNISFAGAANVVPLYFRTIFYVDNTGTLQQYNGATSDLSPLQRVNNLFLGIVVFLGGTVQVIQTLPDIDYATDNRLTLLGNYIRNINDGNNISANGANLQVNKGAGTTWRLGSNFATDRKVPDITTDVAATPIPGSPNLIGYRNGSGGWTYEAFTGSITPQFWDNGSGVKQTVSNNKFTNQRVYFFNGTNTYVIYLGRTEHSTLTAAATDAINPPSIVDPSTSVASLIGTISVAYNATALNNTTQATFTQGPRMQGGASSGGTSGTQNLQSTYLNSLQPQITTTSTLGSVDFQNGTASDTNPVTRVKNIAGTVTQNIAGNGEIYTAATPTATAFSHYFGETASDGVIRPKTLANVKTEIVTTAAVDAAKPNILTGTGTANTILKATGTNTYGNSNITDNGTFVSSSTDMTINSHRFGRGAGNEITNIAIGQNSLSVNTTGVNNTGIGQTTLQSNTTGVQNVGLGHNVLTNNTTGNSNLGIGTATLYNITSGSSNNIGIGVGALVNATLINKNTSIGDNSFYSLLTGDENVSIGRDAGRLDATSSNLTSASGTTLIGASTKPLGSGQSNQTVVGYEAIGLGSNTTVVGNSSTQFGRWWGNLLVGTSTNNGNVGRFAGMVDVNALTINNTPTTSAGSYDILTRNTSTGVVEKVASSLLTNNVNLTGNQVVQGVKEFTNSNNSTMNNGIKLINNGSGTGKSLEILNNSSGRGISLTNSTGTGVYGYSTGSGRIYYAENTSTGTGFSLDNQSTGVGAIFDSRTASTGDLFRFTKSSVLTTKIDQNGVITAASLLANGVIRLKNYTVATLPAGTQGDTAYVTDATAPAYLGTLTGGGSVVCPVFFNGTAWVSH